MAAVGSPWQRLFAPSSIAIIGASRSPGARSALIETGLRRGGYEGAIYRINPLALPEESKEHLYPSLNTVPDDVDLALVLVPFDAAVTAINDCAQFGVGVAVVYAAVSMDAEIANRLLLDAARGSALRILGPNCLGMVSRSSGLVAAYRYPESRVLSSPGRSVALVGQSGGVLRGVAAQLRDLGVFVERFVSTGNEADIGLEDMLEAALDDSSISAVLVYAERLRDPARVVSLAELADVRAKTLVLLRGGLSGTGREIARSHTGAVASDLDVERAVLARAGVSYVSSMSEAAAVLAAARSQPTPPLPTVAVVTVGGGVATVLADQFERADVKLARLSPETEGKLIAILAEGSQGTDVHNPIDLGSVGVSDRQAWIDAVAAVFDDPDVGIVVAAGAVGYDDRIHDAVELGMAAGKPFLAYELVREGPPVYEHLGRLRSAAEDGTPVYWSDHELVSAVASLALRSEARLRRSVEAEHVTLAKSEQGSRAGNVISASASEYDLKQWLETRLGIGVPRGRLFRAQNIEEALISLHYPVVAKASHPAILHKKAVGAVTGRIDDRGQLVAVLAGMRENLRAQGYKGADTFLIEEFVVTPDPPDIEWLIGVTNRGGFGPVVVIGVGGQHTETVADIAMAPTPTSAEEAERLMTSLRTWPLICARLGLSRSIVVRKAIGEAVRLITVGINQVGGGFAEFECNPVIVTEDGRPIALDALIVPLSNDCSNR